MLSSRRISTPSISATAATASRRRAKTYFGKDVSELNLAECATLAVITKAPTTYNPLLNPESNKKRQELCLKYMLEEKAISKEEYEEAVNYKLVFTNSEGYVPKAGKTKKTTEDKNKEKEYQDFYVDYVIKSVCQDLMSKYGYTYRQANGEDKLRRTQDIFRRKSRRSEGSQYRIFKQNRFR